MLLCPAGKVILLSDESNDEAVEESPDETPSVVFPDYSDKVILTREEWDLLFKRWTKAIGELEAMFRLYIQGVGIALEPLRDQLEKLNSLYTENNTESKEDHD